MNQDDMDFPCSALFRDIPLSKPDRWADCFATPTDEVWFAEHGVLEPPSPKQKATQKTTQIPRRRGVDV